jgi:hypothetical protein
VQVWYYDFLTQGRKGAEEEIFTTPLRG